MVERPSTPVHTHLSPRCCQPSCKVETGKLCPLIIMKDLRVSHTKRLLQCLQTAPHIHRDGHRPRQDIPTEPIHHCHQVHKSTLEPNIRDVRTPDVIHPRDRHP